ncbi:DUF808 domain-containing protein [Dinoroseobacter sp. PD6]|uniref:DUF808 domain-containing protein n=1 Tax=Dinoroseobacter sp. PD6 TaxID=3028384 RepID=UPI00237BCDA6|nr:DUF808 domain-containing protein [Dinoroseobacter sp. PD6]MDD9715423.1 DUF808 domain-containing protein [Dinoroseobacter sp. PD6]
MSGLIALLDDVAALAKVAAASLDDVVGQATKAGAKAAGAVIDDAAVTPKYVQGFEAARELPIVWRIAKGSIRNKLVILLPVALLLSAFAPWLIPLLLMLGGAYLCFEGAEKILHVFHAKKSHEPVAVEEKVTSASLEEAKVAGAIKTDFILSAEIMTIALAALPATGGVMLQIPALALVALGITALVYGSVAVIVKADDVGLHMAQAGRLASTRALGRGIVTSMPTFLKLLTVVGTAAMLWVGGSIILHGLEEMGVAGPAHAIHAIAEAVAHTVSAAQGAIGWLVTATLDGVFGLILGLVIVPLVTRASALIPRG